MSDINTNDDANTNYDDTYVKMINIKNIKMMHYSTWNDIMKNTKITDIQDPIIEMELNKYDFENIYKEIVCELQGKDDCYESYIDYYFTTNPVKSYVLSFKNETRKKDFYNIGLEKKSVLSLIEVQEGEDKDEKKKRQKKYKL
tara:strand:+ start:717 stop:1145 length:429 start_codon:yes stop_codon:yes gene_type:complete